MRSHARTTTKGPQSVLDLKRPPTSPGEMLREEFLRPANLTQVEAARRMQIPLNRLNEIIRGRRGDHGGYRTPARTVVQDVSGVLDEPPGRLGSLADGGRVAQGRVATPGLYMSGASIPGSSHSSASIPKDAGKSSVMWIGKFHRNFLSDEHPLSTSQRVRTPQ